MSHGPSKTSPGRPWMRLDRTSSKNAADGLGEPHPRDPGRGVPIPSSTHPPATHPHRVPGRLVGCIIHKPSLCVNMASNAFPHRFDEFTVSSAVRLWGRQDPQGPQQFPCWSTRMKWERSGNLWGNYRDQLSADAVTAWLAAYYQGRSEGETSSARFSFFVWKKHNRLQEQIGPFARGERHTAEAQRTLYVLQWIWTDDIMKKGLIGPERTTEGLDHSAA